MRSLVGDGARWMIGSSRLWISLLAGTAQECRRRCMTFASSGALRKGSSSNRSRPCSLPPSGDVGGEKEGRLMKPPMARAPTDNRRPMGPPPTLDSSALPSSSSMMALPLLVVLRLRARMASGLREGRRGGCGARVPGGLPRSPRAKKPAKPLETLRLRWCWSSSPMGCILPPACCCSCSRWLCWVGWRRQ